MILGLVRLIPATFSWKLQIVVIFHLWVFGTFEMALKKMNNMQNVCLILKNITLLTISFK